MSCLKCFDGVLLSVYFLLQISKEDCHFFDPIFLNEEKEIIREYDFNIISHNEVSHQLQKYRGWIFNKSEPFL